VRSVSQQPPDNLNFNVDTTYTASYSSMLPIKHKKFSLLVSLLLSLSCSCCWYEVDAFGVPQPAGLSQETIRTLARKRYNPINDDDDANFQKYPMTGRVAVITGAAGGIGGQLARVVHGLGATVVALDRNEAGLKVLEAVLLSSSNDDDDEDSKKRICTMVAHQEDLSAVAQLADDIKSRFDTIDVLVNNAGLSYAAFPEAANMKAANGQDLALTVNYLSHFLLTELLLPNLSNAQCGGRVVHVTSTFHWKVDGSELLPSSSALLDGSSSILLPIGYESDPLKQGPKHIGRSYANTKLAQIWHSRSIVAPNVASVCACPTWAATGIAGDQGRDFLARFAFPTADCGPGVTSQINAILRGDEELGDALNGGDSFVGNSRILEALKGREAWLRFPWWRDTAADMCSMVLLFGQKFTYEDFIIQKTSPESCDKEKQALFYKWSREAVKPWM
jgi:NAD(P)-dependent dehydrogenase (short-subunit alcohol dehydrogenase family)